MLVTTGSPATPAVERKQEEVVLPESRGQAVQQVLGSWRKLGPQRGGFSRRNWTPRRDAAAATNTIQGRGEETPGLLPSSRPLMFHQSLLLAKLTQKPRTREPGKCSPLGHRGILCCLWVGEQCLLLVCVCWCTYDTGVLRLETVLVCACHRSAARREAESQYMHACASWPHSPLCAQSMCNCIQWGHRATHLVGHVLTI